MPIGNTKEDTLEEVWNGFVMKNIRKKMLNGETLEMCSRCDINVSTPVGTYRDFFNNTYQHLINDVKSKETGVTALSKISFSKSKPS